jgi:H/ACA ribonucleoprotein complex subunit 4
MEFSILNIDKPAGMTSFQVSDYIRRKLNKNGFNIKKTSHFGTLDPQVTGVLPIALNRACRLTGFFLGHDKEYIGIIHLHKEISVKKLQEIINKKFTGKIIQLPPKKSRVKRQEREREVKRFEILEQGQDEKNRKDFLFLAEVQAGTYIRKLCHDLGQEEIGGAHMTELRRIRAGIFKEHDKDWPSINLYEFEKAVQDNKLQDILIPAQKAIKKVMPIVELSEKANLKQILTGKPLYKDDLKQGKKDRYINKKEIFALFQDERFIGIYKKTSKKTQITAKPLFVLN